MSIVDRIKGNPFEKLKKDELNAERIRLERSEKLKIAEVERLSGEKKDLFNKGFQAGEGEKRVLARKIQQLDNKIKLDNIELKKMSDSIRVVDNLIFVLENKKMVEEFGLLAKLLKMPKTKLDQFLGEVNLKDTIRTGKVDDLRRTMETEYGLLEESADDKDTAKLMDIWATSNVTQADEVFEKWDKEKTEVDSKELA